MRAALWAGVASQTKKGVFYFLVRYIKLFSAVGAIRR